jgi:hypothetical protein
MIFTTLVYEGTQISRKHDDSAEISTRIRLRDGRNLAYIERGFPKDKAKYKIILVHGFGSSKTMVFPAPQVIISLSLSKKIGYVTL